jgi:hypothetical protein
MSYKRLCSDVQHHPCPVQTDDGDDARVGSVALALAGYRFA